MKPAQKYYLLAYNAIAFLAWLAYGIGMLILIFFQPALVRHPVLLTIIPFLLPVAQGLAILEIIHAATGLVRSPIGSTAAQVASRILVVILLYLFFSDPYLSWLNAGLLLVSIAWTITELIRYSYYFAGLLGSEPHILLWMRYSFFIVLYPLGVTGEWLIILSPLLTYGLAARDVFGHLWPFAVSPVYYTIFVCALAIAYIVYFPVLYRYMWQQRRKKILDAK